MDQTNLPIKLADSSRTFRLVAAGLLSIALVTRLLFVLLTPLGDKTEHRIQGLNDEPAHFNYVKYVAAHHSFPVQIGTVKDPGAFERNDFEYYQPPLYYAIGAAFCGFFGEQAGFWWCRFFSFFCGVLTVVFIGLIIQRACGDRIATWCSVLFAALLPMHAYFSALVSNDSLSWLLSALIVYELICLGPPAALRCLPWGRAVRLAIWLGAGMLTKSSTLFLGGIVAGYFAIAWLGNRDMKILGRGVLLLGSAALISAPWYLRDLRLYHSLFALNMGFGPPEKNFDSVRSIVGFGERTLHYFWYPMQNLPKGNAVIRLLNGLGAAIIVVHGAGALWYLLRKRAHLYGSLLLGAALLLASAAYISLNAKHPEPEARFLLPAFASITFGFVAFPAYIGSRLGRDWLAAIEVGAVALFPYLFLVFAF